MKNVKNGDLVVLNETSDATIYQVVEVGYIAGCLEVKLRDMFKKEHYLDKSLVKHPTKTQLENFVKETIFKHEG